MQGADSQLFLARKLLKERGLQGILRGILRGTLHKGDLEEFLPENLPFMEDSQ